MINSFGFRGANSKKSGNLLGKFADLHNEEVQNLLK